MTSDEWKQAIEAIGGQVIDVPPDQVETMDELSERWREAQVAFRHATRLLRASEEAMHAHLQLILPQIADWEYSFDADRSKITLLFKKDKE